MEEILKHCRENKGANICIFPFIDTDGSIKRLNVENPFFTLEDGIEAVSTAAEKLRDAPQKLRELSDRLLTDLIRDWEF